MIQPDPPWDRTGWSCDSSGGDYEPQRAERFAEGTRCDYCIRFNEARFGNCEGCGAPLDPRPRAAPQMPQPQGTKK